MSIVELTYNREVSYTIEVEDLYETYVKEETEIMKKLNEEPEENHKFEVEIQSLQWCGLDAIVISLK